VTHPMRRKSHTHQHELPHGPSHIPNPCPQHFHHRNLTRNLTYYRPNHGIDTSYPISIDNNTNTLYGFTRLLLGKSSPPLLLLALLRGKSILHHPESTLAFDTAIFCRNVRSFRYINIGWYEHTNLIETIQYIYT